MADKIAGPSSGRLIEFAERQKLRDLSRNIETAFASLHKAEDLPMLILMMREATTTLEKMARDLIPALQRS